MLKNLYFLKQFGFFTRNIIYLLTDSLMLSYYIIWIDKIKCKFATEESLLGDRVKTNNFFQTIKFWRKFIVIFRSDFFECFNWRRSVKLSWKSSVTSLSLKLKKGAKVKIKVLIGAMSRTDQLQQLYVCLWYAYFHTRYTQEGL